MGILRAWRYVASIDLIDVEDLVAQGVQIVLVDRDNTCVPRGSRVAPREIRDWFSRLRAAGIDCCMVSNNFHVREVGRSAAELGMGHVAKAMKPLPCAIRSVLGREGVPASAAVMVGDQVFTDVVAGNLAGVRTILVRPQSRRDLWYTYAFRALERLALAGVHFEGE